MKENASLTQFRISSFSNFAYTWRASLPDFKAREIIARACRITSQPVLSYTQVSQFMGSLSWASRLVPLSRLHLRPLQGHFHSLNLTNWFTPLCRSIDPCQPTQALAGPFLTSRIPIRPPRQSLIFTVVFSQGYGAHMGDR